MNFGVASRYFEDDADGAQTGEFLSLTQFDSRA
jgi:hypothetical protein